MGVELLGEWGRSLVMRYLSLNPYGNYEVLRREYPVVSDCPTCGRAVKIGARCPEVRLVDPPPLPDALGALDGPEWAGSSRLRSILEASAVAATYLHLLNEHHRPLDYHQVILHDTLRVGRRSIRGGTHCVECGGAVQLNLRPFFLERVTDGPPAARLLESAGVILIREDLAEKARDAGLDLEAVPTLFDDEDPPAPGPTSDEHDWSDL